MGAPLEGRVKKDRKHEIQQAFGLQEKNGPPEIFLDTANPSILCKNS